MTEQEIIEKMESVGLDKILEISFDSKGEPIIDFHISIWYELMEERNTNLENAIIKAHYDIESVYEHINRSDLEYEVKSQYFYRIKDRKLSGHTFFENHPYIDNEVTFNVNDMYADILRLIDLID